MRKELFGVWLNIDKSDGLVDRNYNPVGNQYIYFIPLDQSIRQENIQRVVQEVLRHLPFPVPRLRVGPSTIEGAGRGLFACQDFKKGDLITPYMSTPIWPGVDVINWKYIVSDNLGSGDAVSADGNPAYSIDVGGRWWSHGYTGGPYANEANFELGGDDYDEEDSDNVDAFLTRADYEERMKIINKLQREIEDEIHEALGSDVDAWMHGANIDEIKSTNKVRNNAFLTLVTYDNAYDNEMFPLYTRVRDTMNDSGNSDFLIVDYRRGKQFFVVAEKNIQEGEEIFINYRSTAKVGHKFFESKE
tara:strand:+ start:142 stop:1050 length:909 start_codon:yes stop_codon:yes gene_type:complete